ncbi:MAG: radical SAM protein [Acidobacteriota bacterium]
MTKWDILPGWGRILSGRTPLVSLEITKECPLRCPGCYAYQPDHLGEGFALRHLSDLRGDALVDGVLALVRKLRPIHISIVGGEPLVRYRELDRILPEIGKMGIEVQLVTSAVRPIPAAWAAMRHVHFVVSIDGLRPEHDKRRAPATYPRIIQHIAGHRVTVHCTVTRQMLARPDYLAEFCREWSPRPEVYKIWFSLFTPQEDETSVERMTPEERLEAVRRIAALRPEFPKLYMPDAVLNGYARPPRSPAECIFAQITTCVSADLETPITPCQFGGRPACAECGCIASAGMASIGNYKIAGLVPVSSIVALSRGIGSRVTRPRTVPVVREKRVA